MIYNSTILKNEYKKNVSNSGGLNILRLIQMALAFIVIAWLNSGVFTYVVPYIPNYIRWGLFLAWFGLALTSNKKFAKIFCTQCWPLLLFYFYMLFISFVIEKDLVIYIKSISFLIMVYSIFLYYFSERYKKFQKFLCTFLFLDIVVVAINTYLQLQVNPMLARYLSTGVETREKLLGVAAFYGVGSYGYFYSLVSIILLLGFLFLNYPKKKFLALLLISAFIALLVQAAFTIAILFTFIFLILQVIIRYTNKYTFVAIALLGIISLLIFQGAFASMFKQLADVKGIPAGVSINFNDLALFFSGNDISGTDVNARLSLYLRSVDAFINNILTGTVLTDSNKYSAGGHSAWLDLLANFGLFSIPFFIFLFKAYKYCIERVPVMFKPFVKVYWLYYVCLGFVNTLLFSNIYTIWFLFLPLFISSFFEISEKSAI
jgi:hypothetical protein